jgi:predicted RNA-binding protein with TRAM domain
MDISDDLLCLYSATISEQDNKYTVEVPKQEIHQGNVESGDTYRIAIISSTVDKPSSETDTQSEARKESSTTSFQSRDTGSQPPVSKGERREVEIESLGDQGDGIAKLDGGYVVITPDTEIGERVTVRLENVQENVGFAEVVKRHSDIPQPE